MRIPFDRRPLRPPSARDAIVIVLATAAALAVATLVVAFLEGPPLNISNAAPVYLVGVVLIGSRFGTWAAILTAAGAFLAYDVLFTTPRFSLIVAEPGEWLDLVLFLFLAVVVGRLTALGSERAEEATRRAGESAALFAMSRTLTTGPELASSAQSIVARLVAETGLDRVWISIERPGHAEVMADSQPTQPIPHSPFVTNLARTPGDAPARWVRSHEPATGPGQSQAAAPAEGQEQPEVLRVRMEADGATLGSLRAIHRRSAGLPSRSATRLLALAADQVALAVRRDDLRRQANEAEIARQADGLKSALLDAVSHDLRTPLASIRATAGSLADPAMPLDAVSTRAAAAGIDLETQRLDRLVRGVLDLSRIEAGELRPDLEALDLRDLVEPVVDRLRPLLGSRPIRIDLPDDLPPVRADAVLVDGLLANLLENAARYAPPPAAVAVSARRVDGGVALAIEDAGPGVPPASIGQLFDKFHRLQQPGDGSRPGLGIGLAVVRGMVEAMAGTVAADESSLGGLRVVVELPAAMIPGEGPR